MQLTTCRYTLNVYFKAISYRIDRYTYQKTLRITINNRLGFLHFKEQNPESFIKQIYKHGQKAIPKRLRREIETRHYQRNKGIPKTATA